MQFCRCPCPVCGLDCYGEVWMLHHVIKEHFYRPRGRFLCEVPVLYPDGTKVLTRYFSYSLQCWCGWDAFDELSAPPHQPKDFEVAKLACALHLERDGGVEDHWLDWKIEHLNVDLPPWLKSKRPSSVSLTGEGGFAH